tara:strand:- start:349 stop:453 length:105 start_codon:yes stop_codon:yes gene_type:complete
MRAMLEYGWLLMRECVSKVEDGFGYLLDVGYTEY